MGGIVLDGSDEDPNYENEFRLTEHSGVKETKVVKKNILDYYNIYLKSVPKLNLKLSPPSLLEKLVTKLKDRGIGSEFLNELIRDYEINFCEKNFKNRKLIENYDLEKQMYVLRKIEDYFGKIN